MEKGRVRLPGFGTETMLRHGAGAGSATMSCHSGGVEDAVARHEPTSLGLPLCVVRVKGAALRCALRLPLAAINVNAGCQTDLRTPRRLNGFLHLVHQ
jgi:hypothetical protein